MSLIFSSNYKYRYASNYTILNVGGESFNYMIYSESPDGEKSITVVLEGVPYLSPTPAARPTIKKIIPILFPRVRVRVTEK